MSCTEFVENNKKRKRLLYTWGPGKVGLEAVRVRKHDMNGPIRGRRGALCSGPTHWWFIRSGQHLRAVSSSLTSIVRKTLRQWRSQSSKPKW